MGITMHMSYLKIGINDEDDVGLFKNDEVL
jgi:hypothetical protein